MTRTITIILAFLGLFVGVYAVATQKEPTPELPLARPASVNPFARGVAALGIVEPSTRDVRIVAPEPGLVMRVLVDVGDLVKAGDALMVLDTRVLDADLIRARARVASAQAEVDRWTALPRREDVPPLEAAADVARAQLADADEQLRVTQDAFARGANSDRDVSRATFARDAARAQLARVEADLASLRAGGWEPDRVIAQAQLESARAEVASVQTLIDRLTVRAPRDGQVLRREIDPGEYAGTLDPAMILGDLRELHVRAQVDEEDVALVTLAQARGEVRALARTRGSVPREFAVGLLRVEPFARPKSDLTGANTERVDTRVVDVVFRVLELPADVPLVPGQAVDVFIDAGTNPAG